MDKEEIHDIFKMFEDSELFKFNLKKGDFELHLEKPSPQHAFPVLNEPSALPSQIHHVSHTPPQHIPPHPEHYQRDDAKETPVISGKFITSPMVGTFYLAPTPEEPVFVKVGDMVEEDTTVCIIEAMKVMNEVKAGIKGKITKIMLENGHPLEFGTKIFSVEPC